MTATPCPFCPAEADDLAGHYLACPGVVAAFGPIRVIKAERRSDGLCPRCAKRPKPGKASYCTPCAREISLAKYRSLTPEQRAERYRVHKAYLQRKRRERAKAG